MAEGKIGNDLPHNRHLVVFNDLIMLCIVRHSHSSPFFEQPRLPTDAPAEVSFSYFGIYYVYSQAGKIRTDLNGNRKETIIDGRQKTGREPIIFAEMLVFFNNCDKMAKDYEIII